MGAVSQSQECRGKKQMTVWQIIRHLIERLAEPDRACHGTIDDLLIRNTPGRPQRALHCPPAGGTDKLHRPVRRVSRPVYAGPDTRRSGSALPMAKGWLCAGSASRTSVPGFSPWIKRQVREG